MSISKELILQQKKYQTLVEQIPSITYIVDVSHNRAKYISPQIKTLLGFNARDWLDDPDMWSRQIHSKDRDQVLKIVHDSDENKTSFDMKYRIIDAGGGTHWIHNKGKYIFDEDENSWLLHGIMTDISGMVSLQNEFESKLTGFINLKKKNTYQEKIIEYLETELSKLKQSMKSPDK